MYKIVKVKLYNPGLQEVGKVLEECLSATFSSVNVEIVECPDTREKPFMLAAKGICGSPCLADIGGVEYLLPIAQKDKVYNLGEIAKQIEMPNALMIGAGAGPRHHIGINCEMMPNVFLGDMDNNFSHIAKLNNEKDCELIHLKESTDMCLLANLFISEGKPGKVLRITAKHRKGGDNFVTAMRLGLAKQYGNKPVGMGGVFAISKGKAKLHIMPDYSETPLKSNDDVNNWLKFFDQPAPLSCLSTFVSCDPGLNLRIEHTHCFSDHNVGGHYHEDTTPDTVEYEALYNIADYLYRVDEPDVRHEFGRD